MTQTTITQVVDSLSPIEATGVIPSGTSVTGAALYIVPSRSNPDTPHVVAVRNGITTCTCLGSVYRNTCRHADLVTAFLAAEQRAEDAERERMFADARRLAMAALVAPKHHLELALTERQTA